MQQTIPVEHGGDGHDGGGGGSGVGGRDGIGPIQGAARGYMCTSVRGCRQDWDMHCAGRPCQRSSPELQVAVVLAWRREHVMEGVVCSSLLRCEAHRRDEHEGGDAG